MIEKQPHNYFLTLPEPYQSALLYLRHFFIEESGLTESWKNHTPFYYHHKKWFAFISYHPKTHEIYISFVKGGEIEHPHLISEGRKKMKIYLIDPDKNINAKELTDIVAKLKVLY